MSRRMLPLSIPTSVLAAVLCTAVWVTACSSTTMIDEDMLGASPENVGQENVGQLEQEADGGTDDDGEAEAGDGPSQDRGDRAEPGSSSDDAGDVAPADDLTALVEACETGSDPACDILFQSSALDSSEEATATSCGGRGEASPFCTEGIDPDDGEIWFDDASPGLAAVVDACEGGDMIACDFLYFRSAVGSEFEEIGSTCAGRTEVALPDCRRAFPE